MNTVHGSFQRNLWGNLFGIGCLVVLCLAIIGIFMPCFRHTEHHGSATNCLNNLKQIGTAMSMYEADWGAHYPLLYTTAQRAPEGEAWIDKVMVYAKNKKIARCPVSPDRLTYSFNRRLSGLRESDIARAADVVAAFETVNSLPVNNNLNGDTLFHPASDRMPTSGCYVVWSEENRKVAHRWPNWAKPNHEGRTNILYADGHARPVLWASGAAQYKPMFSLK